MIILLYYGIIMFILYIVIQFEFVISLVVIDIIVSSLRDCHNVKGREVGYSNL